MIRYYFKMDSILVNFDIANTKALECISSSLSCMGLFIEPISGTLQTAIDDYVRHTDITRVSQK